MFLTSLYVEIKDLKIPFKSKPGLRMNFESLRGLHFSAKMSFSRPVIVWVLLISYISCAGASVIPIKPKFEVSITENGTIYVEEVEIDEKKQLEYFHVPAHNEVTEADYLYDFVNNLAVRRVKSQAKCFLEPLPKDLPKPTDLKRALQMDGRTPSSENSSVARNFWSVSGQVD